MAIFKCKMCGGALEINKETVAICQYCGTKQTLPKLDDDRKANLYDRANHFRRNNEFDKAMGIYEQILNEDSTDAESYWSLVLCRYGIEYVEDPESQKILPTVNRAQYTSIFDDEDYKSALKYADNQQKEIFELEADKINEIQKGFLAISQKEEPFDVFICYKETDNSGRRTPDSVIAAELYHELTREGFKVFFSRITLEDKLGQEYEPYIFAALNSSKVMVALGTKPEHFNAIWVKNEWGRYLSLIKNGARKMLIPAYKNMDPYDLPEEFSHLQAQDMSKLGFVQDLVRGIKKISIDDVKNSSTVNKTNAEQPIVANINALLERGFMSLKDSEWEKADEFFEQVLNQDEKNARAYLGKLMVDVKVSSEDEFENCKIVFENNGNYRKWLRFADDESTEKLEKRLEIAKIHSEQIAKKRKKLFLISTAIAAVCLVVVIILSTIIIPSYKYDKAMSAIDKKQYIAAYELLDELGTYKDSEEQKKLIKNEYDVACRIEKLKYAVVDSIVKFGAYEQDGEISNGKEDIEWIVIEKNDNKMLLISKYILDGKRYNSESEYISWEESAIRKWLNKDFYNTAFGSQQKKLIVETIIPIDKNATFRGNETKDTVFILNENEAKKYFDSNLERVSKMTKYANGETDMSCWWLRSPDGACVSESGKIFTAGMVWDFGIRPVIWIDLSAIK